MHPDLPDPGVKVAWSGFDLINGFNAWKKTEDAGRVVAIDTTGEAEIVVTGLPWRFEVCQQVFEEAAVDYGRALAAWWDSRCGKRTGKRVGFPCFKKKTGVTPSFRLRNKHPKGRTPAIRVGDNGRPRSITLPGFIVQPRPKLVERTNGATNHCHCLDRHYQFTHDAYEGCLTLSRIALLRRATRIRHVDVDAFVLAHRPTWDRLEVLVKRRRRLTGAEVDELVDLYQRVSTHLSMVRTASTDSVLIGRLSGLVAQARSAVTGAHAPLWSEFVRFWTVSFPVVAYRSWRWWLGTAVAFFFVTVLIALWVSGNQELQSSLKTPSEIEELVNHDFASYYSENPAGSFALQVWMNNSWVAVQCIGFAILLGIPIPWLLFQNALNLGVIAAFMFDAGKADIFFGLLAPHGLLELTAVFLAASAGMRLGWSVVSPGNRPRGQVLAEQGRAVVAVAVGLVGVLLVSGLIEALVTPSPLPTFVRIGIGVAAEIAFLTYVFHFGRKAARVGESGDVDDAPDVVPTG